MNRIEKSIIAAFENRPEQSLMELMAETSIDSLHSMTSYQMEFTEVTVMSLD